jgi:gamma-butyrobetaine dioxygenase
MTQAILHGDTRMLELRWPDGLAATFPYIWLRDNDPAGFHPDTQERTFDLLSVPHDIGLAEVNVAGPDLELVWQDQQSLSRFSLDWLKTHRPGVSLDDPADIAPVAWRSDLGASGIPRAEADAITTSDTALQDWMIQTKRYGVSIVQGLADSTAAGIAIARRISFLRETNFGLTFEVKSKPNPNNSAYTADALPFHTDLPNQELPPGFQFLHCLRNEAVGGGSLFCDGVAIAEDLRAADGFAFDLLSQVSVPFRFRDKTHDIRRRQKVITLTEDGRVSEVCYNAHIAGILDLAPDMLQAYYAAYRAFMTLTRDASYRVTLKLRRGEMVVFDNRRVMHGRQSFDPSTGARHLHGCYVDRGEFDSRLRVLARD